MFRPSEAGRLMVGYVHCADVPISQSAHTKSRGGPNATHGSEWGRSLRVYYGLEVEHVHFWSSVRGGEEGVGARLSTNDPVQRQLRHTSVREVSNKELTYAVPRSRLHIPPSSPCACARPRKGAPQPREGSAGPHDANRVKAHA